VSTANDPEPRPDARHSAGACPASAAIGLLVALAVVAIAALLTVRTREPDAFATMVESLLPLRGPWGLLGFLLIAALVPIAGLAEAARGLCRRFPHPVLCGLVCGLVLSAGVCTLIFTVPFLGPVLSIPGYPLALLLRGDDRLATIWLVALGANVAAWTTAGLLVGLAVHLHSRRQPPTDKRFQPRVSAVLLVLAGLSLPIGAAFQDAASAAEALALRFDALPGVRYRPGLVYARRGDEALRLDLAVPTVRGPGSVVLYVHGGGWHGGSRKEGTVWLAALARAGYAAATVDYRLAPKYRWPAQLDDVREAVRWLRAHAAAEGYDAQRVALIGWSAGGHLACMLALHGSQADEPGAARVYAAVALSPLTDLTAGYWDRIPHSGRKLLGASRAEAPERYRAASPVAWVDPEDPPILLVHGLDDPVSPADQSLRLIRALRRVGAHGELLALPGQGHRWFGWRAGFVRRQVVRYLGTLDGK